MLSNGIASINMTSVSYMSSTPPNKYKVAFSLSFYLKSKNYIVGFFLALKIGMFIFFISMLFYIQNI